MCSACNQRENLVGHSENQLLEGSRDAYRNTYPNIHIVATPMQSWRPGNSTP